jgi:hypothetical protein
MAFLVRLRNYHILKFMIEEANSARGSMNPMIDHSASDGTIAIARTAGTLRRTETRL